MGMENMDRFFEAIAAVYVCGKNFSENEPSQDTIMGIFEESLSRKKLAKIEDALGEYTLSLSMYAVAQGLKLAADIMGGTYHPEI